MDLKVGEIKPFKKVQIAHVVEPEQPLLVEFLVCIFHPGVLKEDNSAWVFPFKRKKNPNKFQVSSSTFNTLFKSVFSLCASSSWTVSDGGDDLWTSGTSRISLSLPFQSFLWIIQKMKLRQVTTRLLWVKAL